MSSYNRSIVAVLLTGLTLAACTGIEYRKTGAGREEEASLSPVVRYELRRDFFRELPRCVTVLPAEGPGDTKMKTEIENAAARHLHMKFERVIDGRARSRIARDGAFRMSGGDDLARFSLAAGCGHFLQLRIRENDSKYALVWSVRTIGLSAELTGARTGKPLWRATHSTYRGDGGLPLSPLSLVGATFRASSFHLNGELTDSMIDDAMRRIFGTLPDTFDVPPRSGPEPPRFPQAPTPKKVGP
jgi:hypothetical protein